MPLGSRGISYQYENKPSDRDGILRRDDRFRPFRRMGEQQGGVEGCHLLLIARACPFCQQSRMDFARPGTIGWFGGGLRRTQNP